MVKLGLIGAGRWGRAVMRTLAPGLGSARLVAIVSGRPETEAEMPEGCRRYDDWRPLLEGDVVDGIVIAAPPAAHASIALAAMAAGIPVMIEKPLTLAVDEAEAVAAAAEENDVGVMVDHVHLFSPAYRKLKLLRGELGPVRHVEGRAGNLGPYRSDCPVLWDWAPHDVSMALDLLGERPHVLAARSLELEPDAPPLAETVELELAFPSGTRAHIVVSNHQPVKSRSLRVDCAEGTLIYDDVAASKLTLARKGKSIKAVPIDPTPPLTVALTEFAVMVAKGKRDRSGLALGVEVVRVLAEAQAVIDSN